MIQLNLLPDVKLEYIKAQRSRRLIFSISAIVTIAAIGLLILLLSISALQKKHINDLSADIKEGSAELKGKPQIDRVLTVQNQLDRLTELHTQKPAAGKVFTYLDQVVPAQVNISSLNVDFEAQKITIDGGADTLSNVNKFIDTLKFTGYKIDGKTADTKAFKDIVLTSFNLNTQQDGQSQASSSPAIYSIELSFDPVIFETTQNVQLEVPNQRSTRSALPDSPDLFQGSASGGTN